MDMKRLKYIEKIHNQAPPGTEWGVNAHQVSELIQTIKQQHTLIHELENTIDHLHNLLADEEGGGG